MMETKPSSLRQLDSSSGALAYLEGSATRHEFLRRCADRFVAAQDDALCQLIQKHAQLSQGSLNQFLSTPIKSDEEEVRRILVDSFTEFSEQLQERSGEVHIIASDSRLLPDSMLGIGKGKADLLLRQLLERGRKLLDSGDAKRAKMRGEVISTSVALLSPTRNTTLEEILGFSSVEEKAAETAGFFQPEPILAWKSEILHFNTLAGSSNLPWNVELIVPVPLGGSSPSPEEAIAFVGALENEFSLLGCSLLRGMLPGEKSDSYLYNIRMSPDALLLREVVRWFCDQPLMRDQKSAMQLCVKVIDNEIVS
ncbi:MAG: hypothetical protein NTV54_00345 [Ignavibacteriales bacterium]|nr:hypothetical protein [Ignavibacteriales bacterium]